MNGCDSRRRQTGCTPGPRDLRVSAAPTSSASLVLGWYLRTLTLGALVALYGGLILTMGFGRFALLLLGAGAGLEFLIRKKEQPGR